MNRGRSALVLVTIVGLIAGAVWLFASASGPGGSSEDRSGDVVVGKGPKAPKEPAVADLRSASVEIADGTAVFEARVEGDIPDSFEDEAIEFRWEITEDDRMTWIVSASLSIEPTASVVATQFDYRSSTIDRSMPGELVVEGMTVRLTLEISEIERFPEAFAWTLESQLDGDRSKAGSAEAGDVIPDEGSLEAGS